MAAHVIRELLERGYRVRGTVRSLKEAGYRDGYRLPWLDLARAVGDFAVKLLSYTRPTGTGSYMRTHLGKVMRYDNSKIRHDLGVQGRTTGPMFIAFRALRARLASSGRRGRASSLRSRISCGGVTWPRPDRITCLSHV